MIIRYDAESNIGCVRSNNEDMALVDRRFLRDESAEGEVVLGANSRFAAIIADGMGGNDGGELASDIASQEFDTWLSQLPFGLNNLQIKNAVNKFAQATHDLINQRGDELDGFHGMGTTLVGMFVYDGTPFWVNIGDSRLYIYRDGNLRQVSRDHSMRNLHNDPSIPSNLIYNSLGAGEETFADCDIFPLFRDDVILICSDGLSDMIDDNEISRLMDISAPTSAFVEAAKTAGGLDNVSVIKLTVVDDK